MGLVQMEHEFSKYLLGSYCESDTEVSVGDTEMRGKSPTRGTGVCGGKFLPSV